MKKILFALVAMATLLTVACTKDNEEETSIKGRWEAPRFADTPEDIAFVAIFGDNNLDLYVIAWGQHMSGTYTWSNDVVKFNISSMQQAYSGVTYDDEGNMTSWSWMAGDLDAATLSLAEGYDWYTMTGEELDRAREDFGEFQFKVDGNTATSSMVGLDGVIFHKVN